MLAMTPALAEDQQAAKDDARKDGVVLNNCLSAELSKGTYKFSNEKEESAGYFRLLLACSDQIAAAKRSCAVAFPEANCETVVGGVVMKTYEAQ
jgi:hypothetical protein